MKVQIGFPLPRKEPTSDGKPGFPAWLGCPEGVGGGARGSIGRRRAHRLVGEDPRGKLLLRFLEAGARPAVQRVDLGESGKLGVKFKASK